MKKDDAYDSDSCGEDYAGQPPDDDQSFIVPRRGLEPDTGPNVKRNIKRSPRRNPVLHLRAWIF